MHCQNAVTWPQLIAKDECSESRESGLESASSLFRRYTEAGPGFKCRSICLQSQLSFFSVSFMWAVFFFLLSEACLLPLQLSLTSVCQQTSLSNLALLPACFWVLSVLRLLCFIHVSVCWLLHCLDLVLHMPRVCRLPWACTLKTSVPASAASPWAGFSQYCLVL